MRRRKKPTETKHPSTLKPKAGNVNEDAGGSILRRSCRAFTALPLQLAGFTQQYSSNRHMARGQNGRVPLSWSSRNEPDPARANLSRLLIEALEQASAHQPLRDRASLAQVAYDKLQYDFPVSYLGFPAALVSVPPPFPRLSLSPPVNPTRKCDLFRVNRTCNSFRVSRALSRIDCSTSSVLQTLVVELIEALLSLFPHHQKHGHKVVRTCIDLHVSHSCTVLLQI